MRLPHPIPYQGSKRLLAPLILRRVPSGVQRFFEPFAGSAALTIAAAHAGRAGRFIIGDSLAPLVGIWRLVLEEPESLIGRYREIWSAQAQGGAHSYEAVRADFNRDGEPAALLFLLARCVKNAVRFNASGEFNQSPDRRRLGMHPDRLAAAVQGAHTLLEGRTEARCADFAELIADAGPKDFVYLDPPYRGTSEGHDRRYHQGLDYDRLVGAIERLRSKGVPCVVSFDGRTGRRSYGVGLPRELGLRRIAIRAGRSSQATLSGRRAMTVESLYCS